MGVKSHVGVTKVNDLNCVKLLKQGQMPELTMPCCWPCWKIKMSKWWRNYTTNGLGVKGHIVSFFDFFLKCSFFFILEGMITKLAHNNPWHKLYTRPWQIGVIGHVKVIKVNDLNCVKNLKQGQMSKLTMPCCWPWWKIQMSQWWRNYMTYGLGVKGHIVSYFEIL